MMKRNQGFTLVELVIVIVILGILAVTAAPKFFNFATDARISTLNGVKGSITSASAMVYGKAVLKGQQAEENGELDSPAIDLVYGYPAATVNDIRAAVEIDNAEWEISAEDGPVVSIRPKDVDYVEAPVAGDTTACQLVYAPAVSATAKPVITLSTGGC